jgi:hypothetical protein
LVHDWGIRSSIEGQNIFDLVDEHENDAEAKAHDKSAGDQSKPKVGDTVKHNKSESQPSGNKPETDFQSKFLEFSQKKKEDQAGTTGSNSHTWCLNITHLVHDWGIRSSVVFTTTI